MLSVDHKGHVSTFSSMLQEMYNEQELHNCVKDVSIHLQGTE